MKDNLKKESESLTDKTLKGFVWNFMGTGFQAVISVVTLFFLARLLTPEEFGLVGSAILLVNFILIFCKLGFGAAIIQFSELTDVLVNTAFTVVCISSGFVFLILQIFSYEISVLVLDHDVSSVLRLLSFFLLFQGIGIIPESLIRKDLRFQLIAKIKVFAFLAYSITGIGLAVLGLGFWALAVAHLSQAMVSTVSFLFTCRHTFRPKLSVTSMKRLLHFGLGFSLARIGNYSAVQGDKYIVVKVLGLIPLGVYERAYQLVSMPASFVGQILDEVLFPSMAIVQDDNEKLRRAYGRSLMAIGLVMLPLSAICFVLAESIVLILLGNQWTQAILPLRILSLGMFFRSSYKISDSLARALGAVYQRAWRQWLFAILVLSGAYIGTDWGLMGVATSVILALAVNYIMMAGLCVRRIQMPWVQFVESFLPGLGLGIVCGGVAFGIEKLILKTSFWTPWTVVVAVGISEIAVMVAFTMFTDHYRNENIDWIKDQFLSKILRKLKLAR